MPLEKPLENIVTVRGTLKQCFAQLKPETILHADETQKLRWDNEELRNSGAWTADFAQCTIENDGTLYLARRDNNLILENLEEAFSQLVNKGYYRPSKDDAERVKSAESTLAVILSKLDLKGNKNDNYLYFEIDTLNYKETMNEEQKKIAERIHGSMANYLDEKTDKMTSDFAKTMGMLNSESSYFMRIYVPNPKYVKNNAKKGAIARVCWITLFGDNSYFGISGRNVDDNRGALHGVRREKVAAEGGALENSAGLTPEEISYVEAAVIGVKSFEVRGNLYIPVEKNSGVKIQQ